MDRQEAIEIIQKNWPYSRHRLSEALQTLIPEFQESEDERIRKELIQYLKDYPNLPNGNYSRSNFFAWIEKQGEKKSTDKVEPKFKVGDWVVWNGHIICHIDNIYYKQNRLTYTINTNGVTWVDSVKEFDAIAHLWAIQDAKDGDVLTDGKPFIFKSLDANKHSYAYCGLNTYNDFIIESEGEHGEWTWAQDIKPATKEQRGLLFTKMKEVGYEWDAEKKELKMIEQKPTDNIIEEEKPLLEKFKQAVYDCAWGKVTCKKEGETKEEYAERWAEQLLILVRDWADDYIDGREDAIRRHSFDKGKQSIQNPAWSEEDENMVNNILSSLEYFDYWDENLKKKVRPKEIIKDMEWLKFLKERVQPRQKQEWNEEDETNLEEAIYYIRREPYRECDVEPIVDWLESLKKRIKG